MRKQILDPVWCHFTAGIRNPRVWASILLGVGICVDNSMKYLSFMNEMGFSSQIFEPYIVIGNRVPYFMGIFLGALLLLSDIPFFTPLTKYEVLRIGKEKWFWSQILYIFVMSIWYLIILLLFTCMITSARVELFFENKWSAGMYMLAEKQQEFVIRKFAFSFPFPELIHVLTPCQAVFVTMMFNCLYLCLIGYCILAVNLFCRRNIGWILAAMLHIFGYISYANGGLIIAMRYSLLCCALPVYHYIDKLNMPSGYSLMLLIFLAVALVLIGKRGLRRSENFEM